MPNALNRRIAGAALSVALALPTVALATPLDGGGVFRDLSVVVKIVMLGLVVSTLAAVVVCAIKLAAGARLTGGSAYLSGLRLGGPLAGLVGAAYGGLNMAIGLANVAGPVPVSVLAHGVAEVMMLIFLGLVSGSVAVIGNWAVEARIDQMVLRS
jgi:hypothetical protein